MFTLSIELFSSGLETMKMHDLNVQGKGAYTTLEYSLVLSPNGGSSCSKISSVPEIRANGI